MSFVRSLALDVSRPLGTAAKRIEALIGPALNGKAVERTTRANIGWIVLLCLAASVALFLVSAGQGAARRADGSASVLFWSGIVLLLVPLTSRIAWPSVARGERVAVLVLLAEGLFFCQLLYAPTAFVQFDELLHWITAHDILYRHRLFLDNSLLPVSPSYPAIEILATALANMIGSTVFPAAMTVLAVLRAVFITALFLFFEKVAGSARVGALACLIYMGCSNFSNFDTMFAYESLGIVLGVMVLLSEAAAATRAFGSDIRALTLIAMLLASLAVAHHLSAIFCAGYLVALLAVEAVRRDDARPLHRRLVVPAGSAVLAVLLPMGWAHLHGNPVTAYLGPIVENGLTDLFNWLSGGSVARKLFVDADGTQQPAGYRIIGMSSIILLAGGLATGFFRSLALSAPACLGAGTIRLAAVMKRQWENSRIVLLTLVAFGLPVSLAFRLSPAGWEIGNRMSSFVFVSVGFVVAVSIVHFWQARITRWNLTRVNLMISVIVLSGFTTASAGRPLHGPYVVSGDPNSIEAMAVAAAVWTREWLGEGNRFAADRVNRTLLATYGQQHVVTTIEDGIDESRVFLADTLSPEALYPIRRGDIEYLLVDLRLSTALPSLGHYFQQDEASTGAPPSPEALLKFDDSDRVGRIFDNGWIMIFDVRGLRADP